MTRLLIIMVLILIPYLTSCGKTKKWNRDQSFLKESLQVDTSLIAIFPFDSTQYWFFKDCKNADLTNADLIDIENILKQCINNYNPELERQYQEIITQNPDCRIDKKSFVIDLKRYKRQYIAVTNNKGEKEVWVNCFCNTWDTNWKERMIIVNDGGHCYFNLKINLTKGEYYDLILNGEA